jgi:predicted transcriptional regulator of viral defense system
VNLKGTALVDILNKYRLRVFTTGDVVTLTGLKTSTASEALNRLAVDHLIRRLRRGVWANRLASSLNPLEAVPALAAPWPAYVSLASALSHRGFIEEIPQVTFAVSPKAPASYETPLGAFHFHRLPSRLMWGFEMIVNGDGSYPLAEAEKAFLDLTYLGLIPRSPLGFPYKRNRQWNFNRTKLRSYAQRFQFPPLVAHLKKQGLW